MIKMPNCIKRLNTRYQNFLKQTPPVTIFLPNHLVDRNTNCSTTSNWDQAPQIRRLRQKRRISNIIISNSYPKVKLPLWRPQVDLKSLKLQRRVLEQHLWGSLSLRLSSSTIKFSTTCQVTYIARHCLRSINLQRPPSKLWIITTT